MRITQRRLKQLLDYDPLTGYFTWRIKPNRRICVGSTAGTRNSKGYVAIGLDGDLLLAHQLAWLYVYGQWPVFEIDHRNRIRHDNRIANLRPATPSQNVWNSTVPINNTSGVKNVYLDTRNSTWYVAISKHGKRYSQRGYESQEAATQAATILRQQLHGEFSNGE